MNVQVCVFNDNKSLFAGSNFVTCLPPGLLLTVLSVASLGGSTSGSTLTRQGKEFVTFFPVPEHYAPVVVQQGHYGPLPEVVVPADNPVVAPAAPFVDFVVPHPAGELLIPQLIVPVVPIEEHVKSDGVQQDQQVESQVESEQQKEPEQPCDKAVAGKNIKTKH